MTEKIEQLLEKAKSRSSPEIQSELESIHRQVQELQTENEGLREQKKSLQTELEKTTKGTLQLASELEERYQRLFESAVEGIYTTTEDLDEYVMANPAFADLLGYESGEAVCEAVDSIEEDVFVYPDTYAEYAETLRSSGEITQFEYRVRTANGETRWVSDSVRALTDQTGNVERYRGGVIDITEQKTQERNLRQQTNLSIVLNRVLRHNLRNEVSVVRGYTQMMADRLDDDTSGQKALNAIDDLIALSEKARELDEIVARDAEPRPADITGLIDEVVTQVQREYPSSTIAIEADETITAAVLPSFERAIRELVENAVKHSGNEPTVEVRVEPSPNDVQIHIEDDGPGIDDQEVGVLQSGSETPLLHGSGLGLWLTYWIVTSHDGTIDATVTDEGTTLTVSVPRTSAIENGKQLTEIVRARDQYKAGFEEAGDGMAITDDEARILDVNAEAARIFGVDRQKLPGRSLQDFLPDEFEFEDEWGEMKANGMKRDQATVVGADGELTPVEYTAKSDIVPGQHLIVFRDVTEREERERQVMGMKERYETLLEAAPDAVLVADVETGEIIEVSDAAETLFEMPGDEIVGLSQSDLHPPDQTETYRELFEEHGKMGGTRRRLPDGSPIHIVTASGDHIPVEISISTVTLPEGRVTYGIFRDISEQIEQARQIEKERAKFQGVFEDSFDAMVIADDEGHYIDVNESATDLFGVSEDELLGRSIAEFAPEDFDFAEAWEEFKASDKERGTFPLVRADGDERIVEFAATRDIVPGKHLSILRDVTEREERERELTRLKERYETLLEGAPDPVFVADAETGEILEVNSAAESVIGTSRDQIIGRDLTTLHPEEDAEMYREAFENHLAEEEPFVKLPDGTRPQLVNAQGEPLPVEINEARVTLPDGAVSFGIFRDVSERAEHERELAEKTRQLEAIVQNTEEAIYIKDRAGYYQFINESGAALFDMSPEEVIGKHDEDLFDAESAADIRAEDEKVMESGQGVRKETVRYIDGEKHVFLDAKYPYRDEEGEVIGLVGISPDIGQRA